MGTYTKQDAIRIVTSCAEQYDINLTNKNLLILCMDKHKKVSYIEVSFEASNFLHLTGLKLSMKSENEKMSALDFYERCLSHRLSPNDFEFATDGTSFLKLDVLPNIITKNLSASMIGDYNSCNPKLYTNKLVGGVTACIGFLDAENKYVPNTVLKTDIRDLVSQTLRIIAIYRKDKFAEKYDEITYKQSKIDWDDVKYPNELLYLKDL